MSHVKSHEEYTPGTWIDVGEINIKLNFEQGTYEVPSRINPLSRHGLVLNKEEISGDLERTLRNVSKLRDVTIEGSLVDNNPRVIYFTRPFLCDFLGTDLVIPTYETFSFNEEGENPEIMKKEVVATRINDYLNLITEERRRLLK